VGPDIEVRGGAVTEEIFCHCGLKIAEREEDDTIVIRHKGREVQVSLYGQVAVSCERRHTTWLKVRLVDNATVLA
jgi:hypothetical protein